MVTLLGPRDELLRAMEHSFPHLDIHVRGNEFHAVSYTHLTLPTNREV